MERGEEGREGRSAREKGGGEKIGWKRVREREEGRVGESG